MEAQEKKRLLDSMTLEEKALFLSQQNGRYGVCQRLGLYGLNPQDNPRGGEDYFPETAGSPNDGKYHPPVFPSFTNLGMSFDKALCEETGKINGLEARANPDTVHILNKPGLNLKRSPLCGRNFEYFSEDPYLTGALGTKYIKGLQSTGIGACPKHFLANNQEFERMTTDVLVSNRALHEIYGRAFQMVIEDADPWLLMTSYNKVNGKLVNSNPEIMSLLRDEYGYDNVVVSDFLAVQDNKIEAHQFGMDIELAEGQVHAKELLNAIEEGVICEEAVDESIRRILDLYGKAGNKPLEANTDIDINTLHEKAVDFAARTMVLLENKEHILPLSSDMNILAVGELAKVPAYMGGGSGRSQGYMAESPLEAMQSLDKDISYIQGYSSIFGYPPKDCLRKEDLALINKQAADADVLIFFGGYSYGYEFEGYDRQDIQLPMAQQMVLEACLDTGKPVVLVISAGSAVDLETYKNRAAAILFTGYAGEGQGLAIAHILFGRADPGGRLAETFPVSLKKTPAYLNFTHSHQDQVQNVYGEDIYAGYRWYDALEMPVAWPFGYGLSYTEFSLEKLEATAAAESTDSNPVYDISMQVKNIGNCPGWCVVQLYVKDTLCSAPRPEKELKDFAKIYLQPGQSEILHMQLDHRAFEYWSTSRKEWVLEGGEYEILAGFDSRNLPLSRKILLPGENGVKYTRDLPLIWFAENPRFQNIIARDYPYLQDFFNPIKTPFLVLMYPTAFGRLSQPLMGEAMFTEEQIDSILEEMNA